MSALYIEISKRLLVIITFVLVACDSDEEERIFSDSIVISSQEELSSFGQERFTIVMGDIDIIHSNDIVDLQPLRGIRHVGGTFRIENNTKLESLSGLENLITVQEELIIRKNPALTSARSLNSLQTTEYLVVTENMKLNTIGELPALKRTKGMVFSQNALNEFPLLNQLSDGYPSISISEETFSSLSGLEKLDSASEINLDGMPNLERVNFSNLAYLNNINIEFTPALQELNFPELISVSDIFFKRTALNDLNCFSKIVSDEFITLTLIENPLIKTLEGVENMYYVVAAFQDNLSLSNYCAIPDSQWDVYFASGNAYNPTNQDLNEGRCKL